MSITVVYSDAPPSVPARKGVIRVALRASDISGADEVVLEAAMTPNTASLLIVALTDAIAEHNGAAACNVYAFRRKARPKKRRRVA